MKTSTWLIKILISQRKKNILAARRLKRLTHEKELRRQELEVSPANTVGKVVLLKETLKSTYKFTLEISLMHANSVERVSHRVKDLKST